MSIKNIDEQSTQQRMHPVAACVFNGLLLLMFQAQKALQQQLFQRVRSQEAEPKRR